MNKIKLVSYDCVEKKYIEEKITKQIEKLTSYIFNNFSKEITSATLEYKNGQNELHLKYYGRFDDSQIERIQDNIHYIDLVEEYEGEIIFSLDI